MPANPVNAAVAVQSLKPTGQLFGLPILVAQDSTDTDVNKVKRYYDPFTLQTVHGKGTKVAAAATAFFGNKGKSAVVIKPSAVAVAAENIGTAATGTLANHPVSNSTPPVLRHDSTPFTIVPSYQSPITDTPASGTVLLNFYSGEYKFPGVATTSGSSDYTYYDYATMVQNLIKVKGKLGPYEFLCLPGTYGTSANYGDLKGLADIARTNLWFLIIEMPSAGTVATEKLFRTALDNSHALLVAHQDGVADVAASIIGMASTVNPFNSLAYKAILGLNTDYYLPDTDIGKVDIPNTFEGEGINPIHRVGPVDAMTNERTAIAFTVSDQTRADKDEIYASRVRAKINLKARLDAAGALLLVTTDKIGNDDKGVAAVKSCYTKVMEGLVAENAITRDYAVQEPPFLTDSRYSPTVGDAKAKRIGPFNIRAVMVEGAHEILTQAYLEVA